MTEKRDKRQPTFFEALLPLILMALFLGIGYGVFRLRAEILLIAAAFCSGLIGLRLGYNWKDLEEGIVESIAKAMPAMLIVICVGLLIGSWIAAGTIPMLVFYGLKIISPKFFLLTASLVCSVVSLFTGTSWGTVGTMGVAFMGIAHGLGIPPGAAAGAIVAGSYFGDKISPFSDTTNLAPIAAKSNLFDHIRHMLWTTTPAWLLGLIVYFIAGYSYGSSSVESQQMNVIMETVKTNFQFNILLLLPPAIILYFAMRKKPTIPGMIIASLVATILGLIFQKTNMVEMVNAMTVGYESKTGVAVVDKLFSRGGMAGMMHVTLIAFCAFSFAGIVQKTGMLDVLLNRLLRIAKTTGSLILSVVISGIAVALMTGSSFLTILIPGELFSPAFKARGLAAKNLSRTTEDSGTVIVPLIPWSMAGVFMAGTLGVSTVSYLPWAVMCYTGFIFAIIYGYTGFAIAPKIREDETIIGS
ncbi:Na+/H+ antiporter NhaC [candidate division KSB1 bacterium 4484_87]|nr:MAG: Na+/H+ antiporter NhaC [candidate division KSB1 bacterium 4484_87]